LVAKIFDGGEFFAYIASMLVGMDIDGVVADFLGPFLRFVEKKTGCAPFTAETITDLSFKDHPELTEDKLQACLAGLAHERDFWPQLAPLLAPAEWEALEALSRKGHLVFITHRHGHDTYDIHQVTSDWLRRHGISKPVIHFTQEYKSTLVERLGVKLFVDDRHENCQDVAEKTQATVIMPHRHYNQAFVHPRVKRIKNFNELLGYLR
jgi:uncharacterized HAD superfamily protein